MAYFVSKRKADSLPLPRRHDGDTGQFADREPGRLGALDSKAAVIRVTSDRMRAILPDTRNHRFERCDFQLRAN